MPVGSAHLESFVAILDPSRVLTDQPAIAKYATDWTNANALDAHCILFPKSTPEVSEIMRYCHEHHLSVVPSGGRTGLAGGAVAQGHEVVISFEKMAKILAVDPVAMTIEVEAGVVTSTIQRAAKDVGLCYGVDLGARGSCQIGGNLSTNAGGLKYIRYQGTREQVLGLEVVLADGRILDLNRALRKNNTGYHLASVLVGSEGTLGLITKATLRLQQQARAIELACIGLPDFAAILKLLERANQRRLGLLACEFFSQLAYERVKESFKLRPPFASSYPYFAILEVENNSSACSFEQFLEEILEEDMCEDVVLAQSSQHSSELWAWRENITESLATSGHVRKNDICLHVGRLADFVSELLSIADRYPKIDMILFGHVGDGNIHVNYHSHYAACSQEEFLKEALAIEQDVFSLVAAYRGSISAEHGVGLLKKNDLHYTCSTLELELMRKIKDAFDPKGILNPGKIFA